jgi:hypothetical protein
VKYNPESKFNTIYYPSRKPKHKEEFADVQSCDINIYAVMHACYNVLLKYDVYTITKKK